MNPIVQIDDVELVVTSGDPETFRRQREDIRKGIEDELRKHLLAMMAVNDVPEEERSVRVDNAVGLAFKNGLDTALKFIIELRTRLYEAGYLHLVGEGPLHIELPSAKG